jgi:hypothetical protein
LSRYLFLLGALPLLFLGSVHALGTPLTLDENKALSPRDPAFRRSMAEQRLVLTPRTNLWLTWLRYWFPAPIVGLAISAACFVASLVVRLRSG